MQKRILIVISFILLLMFITGCYAEKNLKEVKSTSEVKNEEPTPDPIKDLIIGEINTIDDEIEFKLIDVQFGKTFSAPSKLSRVYKCENNGMHYVTFIFEIKVLNSKGVSVGDIMGLKIQNDANTYTKGISAVVTKNGSELDTYGTVQPLMENTFCYAIEIPESIDEFEAVLLMEKEKYQMHVDKNTSYSNKEYINIGSRLNGGSLGGLTLKNVNYTDKILPPKTSGWYRYYELDNAQNIFLDVVFEYENKNSNDVRISDHVGMQVIYDEKYTYDALSASVDRDEEGLSQFNDVEPLEKTLVHCYVELPKKVKSGQVECKVYYNNEFYFINVTELSNK